MIRSLLAILMLSTGEGQPTVIEVSVTSTGACGVTLGGRTYDPEREYAELESAVVSLPDKGSVRVRGDERLPYRCVGGVIYLMQRHGVGPTAFIAGPSRGRP